MEKVASIQRCDKFEVNYKSRVSVMGYQPFYTNQGVVAFIDLTVGSERRVEVTPDEADRMTFVLDQHRIAGVGISVKYVDTDGDPGEMVVPHDSIDSFIEMVSDRSFKARNELGKYWKH